MKPLYPKTLEEGTKSYEVLSSFRSCVSSKVRIMYICRARGGCLEVPGGVNSRGSLNTAVAVCFAGGESRNLLEQMYAV